MFGIPSYKLPENSAYFDKKEKRFDLPEADIKLLTQEGKLKLGKYSSIKSVDISENIQPLLIQQDQIRHDLAKSINALSRRERKKRINEYIDLLFKSLDTVCSKQTDSVEVSAESTINTIKENEVISNLKTYLDERGFFHKFLPNDLNAMGQNKYVIWPIKQLNCATIIHKAQVQLVKLLNNNGWKLLVVIGDCGRENTSPSGFKKEIEKIVEENGLDKDKIALLSNYFQRKSNPSDAPLLEEISDSHLLKNFQLISREINWGNFTELLNKKYDQNKIEKISNSSVLNNIQPLLIWTLVISIVKEIGKVIVIAGQDEEKQWDAVYNHSNNDLGVIFIQELQKSMDAINNYTMEQEDLIMNNKQDLKSKIDNGNMAQWLFTHFIELPKFLHGHKKPKYCKISTDECTRFQENCIECLFSKDNANYLSEHFDIDGFIDTVFPLANPAG